MSPRPAPRRRPLRRLGAAAAVLLGLSGARSVSAAEVVVPPLPATLAETGLYADFARRELADGVMTFEPQYPLWTDGATKRRWVLLPPGQAIDASDPDVWRFPIGTRFWKEFSLGRPIETRLLERVADGSWRFATYLWSADGSQATLAPVEGVRGAAESAPGVPYDVPGRVDCRACHGSHPATVLGFSALQLSSDRDPLAPHAVKPKRGDVDLKRLVQRRLVVGLPEMIAAHPPRVRADSPSGRAALGYLHGNCSGCHNRSGPLAELGLSFVVGADGVPDALATAPGRTAHYQPSGADEVTVAAPGDPAESLLLRRLISRQPLLRMPPLGTHMVDRDAIALVAGWIRFELARQFGSRTPSPLFAAQVAAPPKELTP